MVAAAPEGRMPTVMEDLREHFDPENPTIQLSPKARKALGMASATLLTVAAIGYVFFGTPFVAVGMTAAAGIGFGASYATGKDGYAWAVVALGAASLGIASVRAIQEGRFFVALHIDLAEILKGLANIMHG